MKRLQFVVLLIALFTAGSWFCAVERSEIRSRVRNLDR